MILDYDLNLSEVLKKILPKNFCLIHYKHLMFKNLNWGTNGLKIIIDFLLKYYPNVVLINDIDRSEDNFFFRKKFDWYDFKSKKFNINNKNIIYLENIDGIDLANTIKLSRKTIACHGTITLLGNLFNTSILDLFYCSIKNNEDYHQYKNSFHEHVPKNENYSFIIPREDLHKTLNKMRFALGNE